MFGLRASRAGWDTDYIAVCGPVCGAVWCRVKIWLQPDQNEWVRPANVVAHSCDASVLSDASVAW